jgi:DNA invertase Pin-like site-specific DNA recombinase
MNKESKAVILARVSSKSQEDEGYSLDSQLKLLQGYCDSRGLLVDRVFKIAETASKEQRRKIFHEMMAYLKKDQVFHLTVEKTDRLTRNFRDAVAIDDWLEADDRRRLHAVKENILLHREARSDVKFMWNIHLSVAKKYTDNLREEAMKGWAEKLAQGWLPAPSPPGYTTVIENGKRIHVPDPETSRLIQQTFERYLEPSYSIATIADELSRIGIRSRKGRRFSKSYTQKILTNPFYIGINRFDGQDYPGAQTPIISKELFNKVQDKMHGKRPTRYRKHNPTLKNLIVCSNCSGLVTWQLQKGYYYGTCQRKNLTCRGYRLLRQDKIEEEIMNLLEKLVCPSPEVINWVADAMQAKHKDAIARGEQLAASITAQIERIKRMQNHLYDDKLAGDISPYQYEEKNSELEREKAVLEHRLSQVDMNITNRLQQKLVLLELSQKAAQIYPRKTPEQKRIIITKLFKRITYSDGTVSVKYTNFAKAIAENVKKTNIVLGGAI